MKRLMTIALAGFFALGLSMSIVAMAKVPAPQATTTQKSAPADPKAAATAKKKADAKAKKDAATKKKADDKAKADAAAKKKAPTKG